MRGVLCSGGAVVAALAGESIWSSDGVDALEVHDSPPGEPDRSRSGDSAEVNLERRLCCKERQRENTMQKCDFEETSVTVKGAT